ncbi:MAG: RimK/LysX family protein [Pseudomonadota bacterium]
MKTSVSALIIVIPLVLAIQASASEQMKTVGLIENVRVAPGGLIFSAKMDTGADHSSVDALSVHRFKRKGVRWVRFRLIADDGRSVTLERELVRLTAIKKPGMKKHTRPVVMLTICLGTVSREVQVNLVDRSRFNYKMLIGRSFMKDAFLVDPSRKFTVEPQCPLRQAQ